MSEIKNVPEPSMEEILSSIRRIIADEQDEAGQPRVAAGSPTAPPSEEDVLELTEVVPGGDASTGSTAAGKTDVPTPPTATASHGGAGPSGREKDAMDKGSSTGDEALVSAAAASASTNALTKLARAATSNDKAPAGAPGKTIEELVVELMRPVLKDWLDQNLAPIVERVVEQEVKKLARRAELL